MARPIYQIADDIRRTWPNVYVGAVPYLEAMADLSSPEDMYFADRAADIVRYFLSNAKTWCGEDARRIKAELKDLIK